MNKRTLTTWLALGHFANDWPVAALWLIVPAIGLSLDLSPAEVGLLFTLFSSGSALAYVPAGLFADYVSHRGFLLAGTFFWVALGYVFAAQAQNFWGLATLLAVAGMGNAAWHPIATGVLARDNETARARAFGIHAIGGSMAEILAPLSVWVLLSFVDWRGVLVISVLPTILMGLCFLRVARALPLAEATPASWQSFREFVRAWRVTGGLRIIAMISLYNMALIALLSMIPLYLASVHDLAPTAIGVVFAGLLFAGAVAQPLVGSLSDQIGRRPILAIGSALAAAATATQISAPPIAITIVMIALAVASLDAIRAAMLATAVDYADGNVSTTLGFAFALLDGIGALGAVLAGTAAGISWAFMFGLAAALAFGAAVLSVGVTSCSRETSLKPTSTESSREGLRKGRSP